MNSGKKENKPRKQAKPKEIEGSQTLRVKRSQIALNPYNPKRHTDEEVKRQVANFKRVGYLGGITWNKTSGKLVDGHRRVQALDIIFKYDGTPATDYEVKVEVVDFDEKTELEQMTFSAVGNGKADYNLIAQYASQIDIAQVGLSKNDMAALNALYQSEEYNTAMAQAAKVSAQAAQEYINAQGITDLGDDFLTPLHDIPAAEKSFEEIAQQRAEQPHESKEDIKAKKQRNTEIFSTRNEGNTFYVMLAFDNLDDMSDFCDATGYHLQESMIIDGKEFLRRLDL